MYILCHTFYKHIIFISLNVVEVKINLVSVFSFFLEQKQKDQKHLAFGPGEGKNLSILIRTPLGYLLKSVRNLNLFLKLFYK